MKHQLENYSQPGELKGLIGIKNIFTRIGSYELLECVFVFLISRICFMEYLVSPFGTPFFAALFSKKKRPSYILFSILGALSSASPVFFFKYTGSMLITMTILLIFSKELVNKKLAVALISSGSLFLNGGIYVLAEGFFAFDFLLLLMECALSFLSFFVFTKALFSLKSIFNRHIFEPFEVMSVVILLCVAVLSISLTENFWPLSHIASILIILFLGLSCGFSVSTPAGAILGFSVGLSTTFPAQVVCIYTLSSLFSGLVGRFGRLFVSGAFAVSALITTLLICPESNGILTVSYVAASCLILFFIPDRIISGFGPAALTPRKEANNSQRIKDSVALKIDETIDSIDSVGNIFHEIVESFKEQRGDTSNTIFDATAENICKSCSLCRFCWNKDKSKTLACTQQMYSVLETKNTLSKKDIPKEFANMCIRSDAFICELNKNYESFKVTRMWAGKVAESKRLVAEQFKNISMILKNMRTSIAEKTNFEPMLESRIAAELDRNGIVADKICVSLNDGFVVTLDKLHCENKRECETIVSSAVSRVLEVPMIKEPSECTKSMCHLKYFEKTKFSADIAISTKIKENSSGNGDSASFFPFSSGKFAIILSDGMGSGEVANFQSSVTVELVKKLLTAGFDKETCVRLINNILMTNADRDTFSTIDLCVINLYTGAMEFIKTGSPNSYILSEKENETVYASSLPAGLVQSIEPDLDLKYIKSNDYLIMATDGITDVLDTTDKNEIFDLTKGFTGSAKELSDKILERALELSGGIATDDMTVAVCALSNNL